MQKIAEGFKGSEDYGDAIEAFFDTDFSSVKKYREKMGLSRKDLLSLIQPSDSADFWEKGMITGIKSGLKLKEWKKGGEGLWANVHAKRKRGESPAKKGDKDYPDSKQWNKLTKAEFGMELQGEEVNDRYADDPTMETSGGDVSDGMRKGGTVYNRRKYSTGAEKYRRGGESLPKYQTKGAVKEKETIEDKRKRTSITGEYYGGVLAGHEIGDIFDFKKGNFKAGFSADHPDVLEWRSVKGFSADKLLNWFYNTQANIPFFNYKDQAADVKTFDINDRSTWEGKNYGYPMAENFRGSSGVIDHPNQNTNWYPTDKDMAHAMSRELLSATDMQIFFYNGQPFTNEEGDEKDVRLGLKAGKQMADLEFRISNANSKSEVTEIMKEFNKNINFESFAYINNKMNPLNLKEGTLMALESILEDYRKEIASPMFNNLNVEGIKQLGDLDEARTNTQYALHNELAKVLTGKDLESGPIIDYVNNILDGTLDSYFDAHVSNLANHSELAQFKNKKEFDEWTKSSEFKHGFWDANNISYVGANGEVVTGKDITIPYNTMYDEYKPYYAGEDATWPIDNFDGNKQFRIYNKDQALESNIYPINGFDGSGNSPIGGLLSWVTGQDFKIPSLWGGSGADLSSLELPVHNPYRKTFEYYDYDENGMVSKTHTIDNPTYNSEASKAYRKMMGNNGDGVGGTITTNMHGNDFLNFMHPNTGTLSTEALENGFAISQNPYYNNTEAQTKFQLQKTQPHQFMNMTDEDIKTKYNERIVGLSGKNANPVHEWNGMNWVGGGLTGFQILKSGIMKAATWKGAGTQLGAYYRNPGKWGYVGSTLNSAGYLGKGVFNTYDKTSIGRFTAASLPKTGGFVNLNNVAIGTFGYNELKGSVNDFSKGDIWGGTKNLAFGALNTGILYNRLKGAQNWMKFPDFNKTNMFKGKFGNYNLGADGLKLNTRFNPATNTYEMNNLGGLSDKVGNLSNFSLREGINNLNSKYKVFPRMKQIPQDVFKNDYAFYKSYDLFKPRLTQQGVKSAFEGGLMRNQINPLNPNVTPSLLPPNYRLGDGINKITP